MFKRRKIMSLLMSLVMIMSMSAGLEISSFAEDDIISYLTYEINDGEVTITDCDPSVSGDIILPDMIEGYPVTKIDDYSFYGSFLESITIPDSVTSIGECAFCNCDSLTGFIIDENNKIYSSDEYGVLFDKSKTKLIQYPSGRGNISYTVPQGIQVIGSYAFHYASYLLEIIIPESVTRLDEHAIVYCYRLTGVEVPDSVTSIGYDAFYGCDFLTVYGNNNSTVHDYADKNSIKFVALDSAENLEKSVLKFSVGSSWVGETVGITLSAKDMAGLESADLEFSFDDEYFEFYSLDKVLPSIVWAGGQYDTGKVSFSFFFKNVTVPPSADICIIYLNVLKPGISEVSVTCHSWDGDPGMPDDTNIKLGLVKRPVIDEEESTGYDEDFSEPDYTDEPEYCFTYAVIDDEVIITDCDDSAAGEIVIPETIEGYPVTMIGENAFKYCTFITDVVLPDSIKEIGASAFSSCFRLQNINIPEAVTILNEFTFSGCHSLKEFVIPDNITDVEMGVFSNCMELEKVVLPDSITKISEAMFNACFNLKEVTIPDTVTEIGSIAFYQCYSLESIVIPESVKKLDAMAFGDIPNLKDIYIYNPDIELVYEYEGIDYDGIYNVTSVPEEYTLEEYIEFYFEFVDIELDIMLNYSDNQEEFEEKYREFKEKYEEIFSRDFHDVRTDLTIHGYDVSTAHDFADKNGISFVSFESEEETPDDSQQGNTEDNTCSRCGKVHNNAISELFCAIKSFFEKIIDFIVNLFN